MAIRMLHFADVHVGMENYGRTEPGTGISSRVRDFLRRMDEMVEYAHEHGVDLAIFAGDAFKNRQPNPTFQREFAHRIRDLSAMCPVVMLVGNHDMPTTTARASSIEIYDTLGVPNVWVADSYELRQFDTRSGPVQVAAAPYPIKARLMNGESNGMNVTQIDVMMQDAVQKILRDLAQQAAKSPAPRVLTGHFTVEGAKVGSERGIMIGRDVAISLSEIADPVWDYVAMGHIHRHQNLTDGRTGAPPVVYSGSLERIDFGEEGDPKGFCWVELERNDTTWKFVPVRSRSFYTLEIDVRRSEDPMARILDQIARKAKEGVLHDAVVKVIIRALMEQEPRINDAAIQHTLLHEAGVSYVAGIKKEIERAARSRLGTSPEGMEPIELLDRYLRAKSFSENEIEILLERAAPLFSPDGMQPSQQF